MKPMPHNAGEAHASRRCHEMLKRAFVKHEEFYIMKSEALCKHFTRHLGGRALQLLALQECRLGYEKPATWHMQETASLEMVGEQHVEQKTFGNQRVLRTKDSRSCV